MIIAEKWYLVYNDGKVLAKGFHTGAVSSNYTIETFDTEETMQIRIEQLDLSDDLESDIIEA